MPFSNTTAQNDTTSALAKRSPAVAASDATRLRVLAGTPHSRRGSVLVLVVGVLALLAIIIVVYTSVGQADVRGGRTIVNQARMEDQSRAMSDYIRRIIGDDATAVRVQPISNASSANPNQNVSVRETTDYPYTDPYARSQFVGTTLGPGIVADYARFDPAGNITRPWPVGAGGALDPRVTSDPFLASTEPTWYNSSFAALPAMPTPFQLMGRQRDWAHMSIISPSGIPVNLANLRGNFSAPSGFSPRPYNTSSPQSISDFLYLWPHVSATAAYMAAPTATPVSDIDAYNSPATWSNNRTETFRPTTWNSSNTASKLAAGDVKFMGNTLADADGDGYYDSVWQELVDVTDPTRPVNLLPGGTGGGVRWFIAPRIIDLSGLVNVNTATSFAVPPDIENPAGLTPSDVDLERLLTTADVRQYFGIVPSTMFVNGAAFTGSADALTTAGRWAFAGILEGRASGLVEVVDNIYADSAGPELNSPPWLKQLGVQRASGGPALGSVTRKMLYTMGGKDEANGQLRNPVGTNANYYLKQPSGYGIADELDLRAFGAVNDPRTRSRLEASAAPEGPFALMSPFRSERDMVTDRDAGLSVANLVSAGTDFLPRSFVQYHADVRHLLTTLSGSRPLAYTASPMTDVTAARPITDAELRVDINPLIEKAISDTTAATNNARGIYPLSAANTIFTNYALALSPYLGGLSLPNVNAPSPVVSESLWNEASGGANLRNLTLQFGGVTYDTSGAVNKIGETVAPLFKGRAAEIAVRSAAHEALNFIAWRDNSRVSGDYTQQPDNRPLAATLLLAENHRADVATLTYTGGGKRFPFWQAGNARLNGADTTALTAFGTGVNDFKAYTFDLNSAQPGTVQRLAGANTSPTMDTGYAVNIYAAQPQPFITAAVSFDMYYDAPKDKGGDDMASGPSDTQGEWYVTDPGDTTTGRPPQTASLGCTIKGNVDLNNSDFLMETVAFQVTNPFDTALTLGDAANGFAYYFEFAGHFYDARGYDDDGNKLPGPVVIKPRESMCFYITSQSPGQLLSRWRIADANIDSVAGGVGQSPVSAWLQRQLTVTTGSTQSVRTIQIDPTNGSPIPNTGLVRILDSAPKSDLNKVVKLWRVVLDRPSGEVALTNKPINDYLVDRLHDPSFGATTTTAGLYRRLNNDQNRFAIPAGPEPTDAPYYTGVPSQRENFGYAITMFGAVRRRTDPNGGPLPGQTSEASAGVMPAWCLEAKHGGLFQAAASAKNIVDANLGFPNADQTTGVTPSDFTGHPWGARGFLSMVTKGVGRGFTTAIVHPAVRHGAGPAGLGGSGDDPADLIDQDLNTVGWIAGGKPTQLPIYPRRRNTPLSLTDVELPPLRPADLLMPWAIGPYQYADPSFDPSPITDVQYELRNDFRHTTLSEAIGFGLNYSRAANTSAGVKMYEFQIGQVLDRCHLPTDRFVPFNDANTNAQWDYNRGDPDPFIGNGVPFALNVLDRFRTLRYGSIDSVMPGTVNINTAPLSVLRMLPFLTPPSSNVIGSDNGGLNQSWMNLTASGPFMMSIRDKNGNQSNRSLWFDHDAQGAAIANRWDLAATLMAYRDQSAVVARGAQGAETGSATANGRVYVDFSRGTKFVNGVSTAVVGNSDELYYHTTSDVRPGRPFMTNVPNIRQEFGFQTPAEIMMALVQDNTKRVPAVTLDAVHLKQLGIDRLATPLVQTAGTTFGDQTSLTNYQVHVHGIQDRTAIGQTGTDAQRDQALGLTANATIQRVNPAATSGPEHFVQGGKSSDYDRKIAIANALLNTISTSSDLYCAYFLVNGYTEADTQGLEAYTGAGQPTEDRYTRPMTPSIQRRYMMVLDRSQCIRAGDKPKVLMFEELPVK